MSYRGFLIALGLAVAFDGGALAAGTDAQSPQAAGERQTIQEANALLQDEIKLAARPQTYVLVDVHQGVVLVKARGLELHRLPLLGWLFKRDEFTDESRELLIFITPKVMRL